MKSTASNRAAILLACLCCAVVFMALRERPSAESAPQAAPAAPISAQTAHQMLDRLAGAWDIVGEAASPSGQVEKRLQGRAVWQWALGGVFMFGDTVLNNGTAAIQEVDTIGFNAGGQFFQRNLLTDQDPCMIWQRGSSNADGSQLTFQSVKAIPTQTDEQRTITTMVDFSQPDQIGWTMLYSQNGAAVGTVRLLLTRASPDQLVGGGAGLGGMPAAMPSGQGSGGDPSALQSQLNQMVASKQQMQKQIESYKAQVAAAQASFQKLNQP
jgi:hypothetical protein